MLPPPLPHLAPERQRAIAAGAEPTDEEAGHLIDCADCSGALDAPGPTQEALRVLRETPTPSEASLRAVEERLLAALNPPRRRPWLAVVAAATPLALAAAWLLVPYLSSLAKPPAIEPVSHATSTPEGSSTLQKIHTGDDELLALEGAATFRVRRLPPGHRFRVRMGADEIEVKGTVFRLQGGADGLREISVSEGLVEVRTQCCGVKQVAAGQQWQSPSTAPATPETPATNSAAPPASGTAPVTPPSAPGSHGAAAPPAQESADELRRRGLAAFDAKQYAQAASLLSQASSQAPQAAWNRDAQTLANVARVLSSPAASIPGMGVGVVAFEKAAQRAAANGDTARAAAARLGAARSSKGEARKNRFCALQGEAGLSVAGRAEATRECEH